MPDRVDIAHPVLKRTANVPARSAAGWLRRGWQLPAKRSTIAATPAVEITVPEGDDPTPQQEDES